MNLNKNIYLIRHGQSSANININNNLKDVGLTDFGILQSKNINLKVDLVICSPLKRALQTLYFSNIKYNKILFLEHARERKCEIGDFLDYENILLESTSTYNNRIQNLANILLDLPYNNIAIVCHGCVIASLTFKYLNNCEIIKADINTLKLISHGLIFNISCCHRLW